jgi:putative DeoR family transcriptional regulator (stage III sporulation protein D)
VKNDIEERVRELAAYLLEQQCTVRAAAARFGVSKSTVHKDISERLEHIDRALWLRVRVLLERNKAERHIRGGLATRRKYRGE